MAPKSDNQSSGPSYRLIFDGENLIVQNKSNEVIANFPATSGLPGSTVADQNQADYGPIPEGTYSLYPSEFSKGGFFRNLLGDWGEWRVPIASASNDNAERKGFFIHGGEKPGSKGCIDVGEHVTDLHNILMDDLGIVEVIVDYPETPDGPLTSASVDIDNDFTPDASLLLDLDPLDKSLSSQLPDEDLENVVLEVGESNLEEFGKPAGRIPGKERGNAPSASEIVTMNKYGETPEKGERIFELHEDAAKSFMALRTAAQRAGFDKEKFTLKSAFRSPEKQKRLFEAAVEKYGSETEARKWVAKVSEHNTGMTFDLNLGISNSSENAKSGAFNKLKEYEWLKQNAADFGLNPYSREPWHWTYNVEASHPIDSLPEGTLDKSKSFGRHYDDFDNSEELLVTELPDNDFDPLDTMISSQLSDEDIDNPIESSLMSELQDDGDYITADSLSSELPDDDFDPLDTSMSSQQSDDDTDSMEDSLSSELPDDDFDPLDTSMSSQQSDDDLEESLPDDGEFDVEEIPAEELTTQADDVSDAYQYDVN